jgi:hypothetical protein
VGVLEQGVLIGGLMIPLGSAKLSRLRLGLPCGRFVPPHQSPALENLDRQGLGQAYLLARMNRDVRSERDGLDVNIRVALVWVTVWESFR